MRGRTSKEPTTSPTSLPPPSTRGVARVKGAAAAAHHVVAVGKIGETRGRPATGPLGPGLPAQRGLRTHIAITASITTTPPHRRNDTAARPHLPRETPTSESSGEGAVVSPCRRPGPGILNLLKSLQISNTLLGLPALTASDPPGVTAPSCTNNLPQRVAAHGLLIQSTSLPPIETADGPSPLIGGQNGQSLLEGFRPSDQKNEGIRRRLKRGVEHTNIPPQRKWVGAGVRCQGTTALGHGIDVHQRRLDVNILPILQSALGSLPREHVPRENYFLLEPTLPNADPHARETKSRILKSPLNQANNPHERAARILTLVTLQTSHDQLKRTQR